jgi:hypothetical protein
MTNPKSEAAEIAEMFLSWEPPAREQFIKSLGGDHPWHAALMQAHNRLNKENENG